MAHPTDPQYAPGDAMTLDQRIDLLDRLVMSELSPAIQSKYRQLIDLRLDRGTDQWERLAAALGRHFPGLAPAIAVVWRHVLSAPISELERCCQGDDDAE